MKELFGKSVPHTATIQLEPDREQIAQFNLGHFRQNKFNLLDCFITMDETWIYHDPKSKQECLQWTEAGCLTPKQEKSQLSEKRL